METVVEGVLRDNLYTANGEWGEVMYPGQQ